MVVVGEQRRWAEAAGPEQGGSTMVARGGRATVEAVPGDVRR
jgi:hypothetical protein